MAKRHKTIINICVFILVMLLEWIIAYKVYTIKKVEPLPPDTIRIVKEKRDSILLTINDTIVNEIEKKYEKDINDMFNVPTDSQCIFWAKYISKNARRFSNSNNR